MNDVPTLKEELDRKTIDSMSKLVCDYENGRTTIAQFNYGALVLWNTVAGLVDVEIQAMLETLEKDRRDSSFYTRGYFRKPDGTIARVTNTNNGLVRVEVFVNGKEDAVKDEVFDMRDETHPYKCGKDKYESISEKLILAGFHEI